MWGIRRERQSGTYYWIRDSWTGDIKGFPTKSRATDYGRLSFGPFPKRDGALSESRVPNWRVERIPNKKDK